VEPLAGERRTAPVTKGQIAAPDGDLADLARRQLGAGFVEDHALHILRRIADRHDGSRDRCLAFDDVLPNQAGLGRTQTIGENARGTKTGAVEIDMARRAAISFQADDPQRVEAPAGFDQPLKDRGYGMKHSQPLFVDQRRQALQAVAPQVERE
jgi:hypothetical protein